MSFTKVTSSEYLDGLCSVGDVNYYCNEKSEKPLEKKKEETFDGGLKCHEIRELRDRSGSAEQNSPVLRVVKI